MFVPLHQIITAHTFRPRRAAATEHGAVAAPGATPREHLRAEGALVVLWAAFAVGLLTIAIARGDVGVLVVGAVALWLVRTAWTAATRPRDGRRDTPIRFD